ncbi:MAG: hypothetical protein AAF467_18185 [Actinomycetota bacterium]
MAQLKRAAAAIRRFRARRRRLFIGLVLLGGLFGVHVWGPVVVTAQYHPNNEFETGDQIGLGFGTADRVYGQDGIADYHNLDRHTVVVVARVYLVGPLYVGTGVARQTGSTRSVTFERADRSIGANVYDDLELTVHTTLHDQLAPVASVGIHPSVAGVVGVLAESNFGLANPKSLAAVDIVTNQPLSSHDEAELREAIRRDAESEWFGIATAGPTYGLPWGGGGVVPWSIAGWLWRRRATRSKPGEAAST